MRAQPVGAPVSSRSLKNLDGEHSSGERPQPSSSEDAAVRSSPRDGAGDGSGQGSSFTYTPSAGNRRDTPTSGQGGQPTEHGARRWCAREKEEAEQVEKRE